MRNLLYTLLSAGLLLAAQSSVVFAGDETVTEDLTNTHSEKVDTGKVLFEQHCLSCHQPRRKSGSHCSRDSQKTNSAGCKKGQHQHSNRLAPPMPMVKKHYLDSYPQRDDFIEAVVSWVAKPKPEKAQLHKAVKRFGLMQALPLSVDDRKQIAAYIYDRLPTGHCPKRKQGHTQK